MYLVLFTVYKLHKTIRKTKFEPSCCFIICIRRKSFFGNNADKSEPIGTKFHKET